jgi:hypothetical protein
MGKGEILYGVMTKGRGASEKKSVGKRKRKTNYGN